MDALAAGFSTMFPIGSKKLTTNKYSSGQSDVGAFIGRKYIFDGLMQHWWDVTEISSNFGRPTNATNA